MHTEADFVRAMDADPTDATLRLIYADWLDEQGGCGDGWRAMGALGCRLWLTASWCGWNYDWEADDPIRWAEGELPRDWYDGIVGQTNASYWRKAFPCRHAAESAAAEAFLRLPESRRAELLGRVEATA